MPESQNERIDALKSEAAQLVPKLLQMHGYLNANEDIKLQRKTMDILAELTALVSDLTRRVSELEKK